MFGLRQSFSDNSNLIILVDIQHLHENVIHLIRKEAASLSSYLPPTHEKNHTYLTHS